MAEKKYYWLKMPKGFLDKHYMKIIRSKKPDGSELALFYIWMITEAVDHAGELRYSSETPYDVEMLSEASGFDEDTVSRGLALFKRLELIEYGDDETIFMIKGNRMIGSETSAAGRMRNYRNRNNVNNSYEDVADVSQKSDDYIDIEIDIDKDIDNTVDKSTVRQTDSVRQVVDAWNKLSCFGISTVSKIGTTSKRYKSLVARLNEFGIDDVLNAIEKIKDSPFLQGKNRNGWTITFDWFVLPNNFPKVLDGNYLEKGKETDSRKPDQPDSKWQ